LYGTWFDTLSKFHSLWTHWTAKCDRGTLKNEEMNTLGSQKEGQYDECWSRHTGGIYIQLSHRRFLWDIFVACDGIGIWRGCALSYTLRLGLAQLPGELDWYRTVNSKNITKWRGDYITTSRNQTGKGQSIMRWVARPSHDTMSSKGGMRRIVLWVSRNETKSVNSVLRVYWRIRNKLTWISGLMQHNAAENLMGHHTPVNSRWGHEKFQDGDDLLLMCPPKLITSTSPNSTTAWFILNMRVSTDYELKRVVGEGPHTGPTSPPRPDGNPWLTCAYEEEDGPIQADHHS
jgi:hypothetical protein